IFVLFLFSGSASAFSGEPQADTRREISRDGITWIFDKPVKCGRFITGDWWVIGPVTIVSVTPRPGPVTIDRNKAVLNRWGDTSVKTDTAMRNGSMIVLKAGYTQGYDSRNASWNSKDNIRFPLVLEPDRSLVSTISNDTLPVPNFCSNIMWDNEKLVRVTLNTAAVLTCLKEVPPADAFRPPFTGTQKPLFRAGDIRWELLPRLEPAGDVPSWEEFEGYFSRCWPDHLLSWEQQELVPNNNMPNYGREHARVISIASLMLMLDIPRERKEKLAIGMIQHGIDLYGTAMNGGYWNEGGGHSSGRKWPILFAALMLGDSSLNNLPRAAIFQEDTQTYYGHGWFGQAVLWQMIFHHGRRDTYEEKHPSQWEQWDRTSESYRTCCTSSSWIGMALAARYMKAVKAWGHDAFFDYADRWMREDDPYAAARGNIKRPSQETTTFDPFVTSMWKKYRALAPDQEYCGRNFKFVWTGDDRWMWEPN
ncbi:MAG: hypothetical protein ACM3UT_13055, partial [Chloroflexota bacterium]